MKTLTKTSPEHTWRLLGGKLLDAVSRVRSALGGRNITEPTQALNFKWINRLMCLNTWFQWMALFGKVEMDHLEYGTRSYWERQRLFHSFFGGTESQKRVGGLRRANARHRNMKSMCFGADRGQSYSVNH